MAEKYSYIFSYFVVLLTGTDQHYSSLVYALHMVMVCDLTASFLEAL